MQKSTRLIRKQSLSGCGELQVVDAIIDLTSVSISLYLWNLCGGKPNDIMALTLLVQAWLSSINFQCNFEILNSDNYGLTGVQFGL